METSPPQTVECRYWAYTCGNLYNNYCTCCAGSYQVYADDTPSSIITCPLCPIGKYQDEDFVTTILITCKDCPAGKYTLQEGTKSINDCVPLPPPAVPTATIPCGSNELFIDNALLSSENTQGIDYGALAKIQNPWRRRRTLPEGV